MLAVGVRGLDRRAAAAPHGDPEREAAVRDIEALLLDIAAQLFEGDGDVRLPVASADTTVCDADGRFVADAAAPMRFRVAWSPTRAPARCARLLRVVCVSAALVRNGAAGAALSKREVYYGERAVFRSQAGCDRVLRYLAAVAARPRAHLGVFAAERGAVDGDISIHIRGAPHPVRFAFGEPRSITRGVERAGRIDIGRDVAAVLVVEKDTAFRRLAAEGFPRRARCVLVTGRGMPDNATRHLLGMIAATRPDLPMYALVDGDPWGCGIFAAYRFGTRAAAAEGFGLPALRHIGVSVAGLHYAGHLGLPGVAEPLSERDVARARSLLARPETRHEPALVRELRSMLALGAKVEIEAVGRMPVPQPYTAYVCAATGLAVPPGR